MTKITKKAKVLAALDREKLYSVEEALATLRQFKGKFDGGWDKYREETLARQKKLGVVPKDTKLTVRSKGLPAWDSLNAEQKRLYARMMEVFAGYAAHCDHELGRVIEACQDLPDADNTLIIYIAGDNGASAEGGIEGSLCENMFFNGFPEKWQDNIKAIDELGGPKHFNHFPSAWAHAMNTPFQWTKQVASHFGGTRNGMVLHWPQGIKAKGEIRSQFHHVIDIVPTILDCCGGLGYSIDIAKPIGSRISAMTHLKSGKPIDPNKEYTVAGWASVNEGTEGPPVWRAFVMAARLAAGQRRRAWSAT